MEKSTAYVETSVLSYLVASPSRDVITLGRQQLTSLWWERESDRFELLASDAVVEEASRGDAVMAARRLEILARMRRLPVTSDVEKLARDYIRSGMVPVKEPIDALHLALASIHAIDYLVTWNCRHIANAHVRRKIRKMNENLRLAPPRSAHPRS